jgi:hypothetical protein
VQVLQPPMMIVSKARSDELKLLMDFEVRARRLDSL